MKNGGISERIDTSFDAEPAGDYRSSRIGASIVGNPCEAYLEFAIRGFPEQPTKPRFKRVFRDGHRIEKMVIADLKKAGLWVSESDPITGKQHMWDAYGGFLVFYADGIIEGYGPEPMLLEIKSMNGDLWKTFRDRGVKVSHPKYFDQLQVGMGLSGYKSSVLVAYNKDTSEYWDEVVEFDVLRYHYLLQRAVNVLTGNAKKVAKDPTDWRCKACPKRGVCWENAPVEQDMRTCRHSKPMPTGWECEKGCVGVCMGWERFEPLPRE